VHGHPVESAHELVERQAELRRRCLEAIELAECSLLIVDRATLKAQSLITELEELAGSLITTSPSKRRSGSTCFVTFSKRKRRGSMFGCSVARSSTVSSRRVTQR
jgi:hypothetical protein